MIYPSVVYIRGYLFTERGHCSLVCNFVDDISKTAPETDLRGISDTMASTTPVELS